MSSIKTSDLKALSEFISQKTPLLRIENPTLNCLELDDLCCKKWSELTEEMKVIYRNKVKKSGKETIYPKNEQKLRENLDIVIRAMINLKENENIIAITSTDIRKYIVLNIDKYFTTNLCLDTINFGIKEGYINTCQSHQTHQTRQSHHTHQTRQSHRKHKNTYVLTKKTEEVKNIEQLDFKNMINIIRKTTDLTTLKNMFEYCNSMLNEIDDKIREEF